MGSPSTTESARSRSTGGESNGTQGPPNALVNVEIGQFAHISAQIVGTYGVLVCLAIGAFWSWQLREALRPRDGDL